jgi:tetratricopeptide (TPR) repeat protein
MSKAKQQAVVNKPKQKTTSNPARPPVKNSEESKSPKPLLLSLIIFIIAFLLYSGSFGHRFVLDDHGIIKTNNITKAPVSWENTETIFTTPLRKGSDGAEENSLYRPVTKLIFNLEWSAFDGDPHAFHVVNVLFYALLCLMVFVILYDAFRCQWIVPFIATLLFVVHPLHAEAVANVKSLDEILGLLTIILSMRCLQLYAKQPKPLWIVLAYFSFLVSLFSKESAVVGVGLFPLFMYFFSGFSIRRNLTISGGFLICALLFIYCRWAILHDLKQTELNGFDNLLVLCSGPAQRFATAVYLLGLYVLKFFVPYPLSCDYSYSSIQPVGIEDPKFIISFLALAGMLIYGLINLKSRRPISFGILWFFIGISIASNIFFLIGTSFGERLMFLPSLGLCLSVSVLLNQFFNKQIQPSSLSQSFSKAPVLWSIVAAVCLLFSIKTYSRTDDWKTDYHLYSRDIKYYPNSVHLLSYMGMHLSTTERKEVLTDQLTVLGYNVQQITDSSLKENRSSIDYLNRALNIIHILTPEGYNQLAKAYNTLGARDSARKYFQLAFEADPMNATYINNMGTLYYTNNQLLESLPFFMRAWKIDTSNADYMNNIGCVYGATARPDSAIYWFEKALTKDSINLTSLRFLDITWRTKGNIQTADYYKNKMETARIINQNKRH